MYPLEKKDICDYDPRCIMSSGLVFDYIIMNIIRNKKLARHNEKKWLYFYTDLEQLHLYVQGVTLILLLKKKELTSV